MHSTPSLRRFSSVAFQTVLVFNSFTNKNSRHLGFTARPCRLNQGINWGGVGGGRGQEREIG